MHHKKNISIRKTLTAVMLMFMMVWANHAFAASDPIYAKWDFTLDGYPETTIQNTTANLTANEGEALEMVVDATSGKLADNSGKSRAQINKGTKLRVPIVSGKDVVEVKVNDGSGRRPNYVTINGDPMETAIVSHKATAEEVVQGYVEIKAEGYDGSSSNTYIFYVSVTQYPPVYEERQLYYTEFAEGWTSQAAKVPPVTVDKKTTDGQTLTFTLNNTQVDPAKKQGDNACVTTGALIAGKENNNRKDHYAYVETSELSSVTKIKFVQAATGGKDQRGWGVQAICDGDTTNLYTTAIQNTGGEEITINGLDLKNVKLRFYNLLVTQNAYMESIDIYGMVEVKDDVNITYYDTDGTTVLATESVSVDKPLTYKEGVSDMVTVPSGSAFRGWFDGTGSSALKVREGSELSDDLSLYAWATPIETTADYTEYTYDMTMRNFYPEDHELIDVDGAAWESRQHGWLFNVDGTIKLQVATTAQIDLTLCNQSQSGTITVTDESDNEVTSFAAKTGDDATVQRISYSGSQGTLTLNIPADTYIHGLTLYNYKPVYVSFKFPNDKTEGKCPETIKANTKNEVTMPDNTLFSRLGWTFQGWTDGINVYEGGKTYVINESVTLTPKVTENKYALTDTNTPVSVTWPFDYRKAPAINLSKTTTIFVYNKETTVEGERQDIALKIDASNGKVLNTDDLINSFGNGAEGAQVNDGTIFTVPAVYGMTVIVHASDKVDDRNQTTSHFGSAANDSKISIVDYTISAEDQTISDDGKTLSIVYRGDATSLDIKVDHAGTTAGYGFYKDITVIYPVLPFIYTENVIEDADPTKYPNEKAENAGTVDYQSTTSYPNTGNRHKKGDVVTVIATPDYGYNLKGYRVKGTTDLLPTKEITNEAGTKLLATDYTVGEGITYIEAIYTHKPLYKLTLMASDTSLGSVTLSPIIENFYNEVRETGEDGEQGKLLSIESWFTEGTEITASANPAAECVVDYWTEGDDATHLAEANSYTFTTTAADQTIVVHLKRGEIGSVVFDISNAHVNGESVASLHEGAVSMAIPSIENVRSFTVPTNYTFFKSVDDDDVTNNAYAYHLLYWVDHADNDNRYELGKTYSFKTQKTMTLTPVFTLNPTARTNRVNNPLVRYDFGTKVYQYYDSSTKETRNTCAPEVNIGNNTNTYWTAQAYFEVLTNGVLTSHTRDVTMYVNTGSKGYIRNQDLGDWCAFGPGTTFWCTSSTGTTVSILSYSKITTTTVDGVVPTLNEERTAEERKKAGDDHIYVYSYTTQNSATTMPIIIGDDYSYYQWIEVQMLAANMVNMHTSVDDSQHGKINDVESLSDFGAVELEDGGHSFRKGDRVRISFERLFGFEFDKLVETSKTDDDGNPTTLLQMNTDGTVNMVDDDYVMHYNIPRNADGTWGTAEDDGKTVFTLKATEPTEKEAADGKRTSYELEYDITNHHDMELVFKEKPTYYVTYNAGSFASGLPPVAQWMEAGDKYTIPTNNSLYYEGNTLDHWVDEDYDDSMTDAEKEQHTFYIGKEYAAVAEDVQLFPVFKPNEFSILDLDENATATWHLTKQDGAPSINYQGTAGILVTQLQKGDKKIDMKIDLDATNFVDESGVTTKNYGKFNNTSSDERIQVNKWSKVYFPATPQCVVRVTSSSGDPSVIMVAGKKKGDTGYNAINANAMEVTCAGDSATHRAVVLGDNLYLRDFAITYKPQDAATKSTIETLTCDTVTFDATEIKRQIAADGYVTFTVSPWLNDGKIPAVTGTATNGGNVTTTKATVFTKETAATVHTALGIITESYPIRFEFATPDDYPVFQKVTINGVEYTATDNVVQDVPQSGIIKVLFNRDMQETTFNIPELQLTSTSSAGKELEFKYWDLPEGGTIQLNITPDLEMFKDIYGKVCQQTLTLTLNVTKNVDRYHHHQFDFIVGKDGTIDDAIAAANANTKDEDHRYFIFVPDGEYQLTGNEPVAQLGNINNGITKISKSRVSLIGQSKDGVTIWNKPEKEGISYTGTIHLSKNTTDFYSQDLTLENRYDYRKEAGAGRAVAFWDQGNLSIMKRVALKSYQDTYYSNNANADYRGYFENSDFYGVVDFLCGDGDIWLEKCDIILRDRDGNNIAAPATGANQQWGYVFNNCLIRTETENPQQFKNKNWTLARAWNDSPAITYLNTKMATEPTSDGWGRMSVGQVLRFHEWRSMNGDGTALLTLGTRTLSACSPGVGSDNCVLTDQQAAQYTLRNVLGGTDAFEPNELCRQIDAASSILADRDENDTIWHDNIEVDDDYLQWDANEMALCYFVFKYGTDGKWKYILNTTDSYADLTDFGSGYYCVRAANQRGGLGAATEYVLYNQQDPYELTIKQLDDLTVDGVPYGWSTICLPFNARVPEGVTVYAATAHDKTSAEDKVEDFTMTLTPVNFIDSEKGYVVYGPAGIHSFAPTSRKCDKETILTGNATEEPLSTENNPGYVLANKAWGLGFYKYSGMTYAPFRAWLPQDMVSNAMQDALATGTRAIRFKIADGTDDINPSIYADSLNDDAIYDLSGKKVNTTSPQGIYISRKKGKTINK